ncbi:cytidylyltransferase domain-containing protein [Candidatus Zixiibacteriota bacterium]
MKTGAIIQARMGSTRLPGKLLANLAGEPVLTRVINRTGRARSVDVVIVATTTSSLDDPLVELCANSGIAYFRGSESDVLDRYYQTARQFDLDTIVRITSDCPMIEPTIIDLVVDRFLDCTGKFDYASNTIPRRTFPRGLDTEVMSFNTLERVWTDDQDPLRREHVTPYIYQNQAIFNIGSIENCEDLSSHRWTLDTQEDLEFLQLVYTHFARDDFSWTEVVALLDQHREWMDINRDVKQK